MSPDDVSDEVRLAFGERAATATPPAATPPQSARAAKLRRRIRALGVWGFLFFLIKGLLWLAIPAAIAAWRWLSG